MACGSRLLDLADRIWYILVWIFVVAWLRWRELWSAAKLHPRISFNKIVPRSSSALAFLRSVGRLQLGASARLPWRKMEVDALQASFFNKCCCSQLCDLQVPLFLLAGLGGEGETAGGVLVIDAGGWLGYLARPGRDSALVSAISKRWFLLTMAIFGHGVGLAVLDWCSSYFFLRKRRIFSYLGAASSASVDPSGLVPGVSRDGRACRWISGDAVQGLDCFFAVNCRVLCVRIKDLVVIFGFCVFLSVKMYQPPK